MQISGIHPTTGLHTTVEFDRSIQSVTTEGAPATPGAEALYLAPGFIDVQVNGFAGVDYCQSITAVEEIGRSIDVIHTSGTSLFFPTVITNSPEEMVGALRNLAAAKESLPNGAAMDGFHVEGPFISPHDGPRGAHPQRWVTKPDLDLYKRMQEAARGQVKLFTLSPEWDEAPAFIEAVAADGVTVSIGHTSATTEQIEAAVAAGATMSTHIGNGAHKTLPRHPNYLWQQLADDRLYAGIIGDGIHVGRDFLRVALRAKGLDLAVLVTDAAMPAGCEPGPYMLGEVEVELLPPGDRVVLRGGDRLAGSALFMHKGVEKLMTLGKLSLADAVRVSTVNPARCCNVEGRKAGLVAGDRADFVLFRCHPETLDVQVVQTWVNGKRVYQAN
ncbi:MAG: N-acetylglucosamine-6-phosphate deacetylase [Bryobacterales bacterium]|nr:N-acetylglucosamine-6-phosphate deacetylase [Bryobacterales bacterium]